MELEADRICVRGGILELVHSSKSVHTRYIWLSGYTYASWLGGLVEQQNAFTCVEWCV